MDLQEIRDLDFNDLGSASTGAKAFLLIVMAALIIGAGYWFIIKDQRADLANRERQEVQLRQEFEQKQRKAASLEIYERQLDEMRTFLRAFREQNAVVRDNAHRVAEQPGEADNAAALDTIVVTAQRREQDATRVPISIEVIGGEDIADTAISTLEEVTLSVPNFQITQTGLTTQTYIRGIGSGNDPAFEQSVAQFVDGVSYGRAQLTRAPFFDLQRVEEAPRVLVPR